jgi:hypothetical protein
MRHGRRILVPLALGLVLPPASVARDPIEGQWDLGTGVVEVRASGSGFTGRIIEETVFDNCTHPINEVVWTMSRSGRRYEGYHLGFATEGDCESRKLLKADWTVAGDTLTMNTPDCTYGFCFDDFDKLKRHRQPGSRQYLWTVSVLIKSARTGGDSVFTGDGVIKVTGGGPVGGGGSTLRIVDRERAGAPRRRLIMQTRNVAAFWPGRVSGGTLQLAAVVTVSDYADCTNGASAVITLVDGAGHKRDSARFVGCGVTRNFRAGGSPGAKVRIAIGKG